MNYPEIEEPLARLGAVCSVSECHGIQSGLLCSVPVQVAKQRWFAELLHSASLQAGQLAQHSDSLKLMERWFDATVEQLNSADFSFQLCLPDDESDVRVRLIELGAWCSGFGYGIAVATDAPQQSVADVGTTTSERFVFPADTEELLTDFREIANTIERDSEGDEQLLMELEEYVRMGVMLITEELRPASAAEPTPLQ